MGTVEFPGRLALQQRVLPAYRAAFFDALANACTDGLSVFAGQPHPGEAITSADRLEVADYVPARNRHIGRISSRFYLCWQSGLPGWLMSEDPDALIVEANPRLLSTRLGAAWMRARGRPVLGWGLGAPGALDPAADDSLERVRSPGRNRFLAQFDGLIAYSRTGAEGYRSLGFPPERVFVAPNAVAARPQGPPPERAQVFDGAPKVLFVGRLQARKRVDLLLRACAELEPVLQPEVWVVGDGPQRAALESLAETVYPHTRFYGELRGAELEALFEAADLFALPGTGGLAVQQAMAHALPVIAAEGDGTLDDLVRPDNGWRVVPGDEDDLRRALGEVLADPGRLRVMGRESYRIVQEEVNLEAMVAAFIRALEAVRG